jgi:DNA-directed RNA polymerase subunit omega
LGRRKFEWNFCCNRPADRYLLALVWKRNLLVNAELCKKALEKVGNPNVLINLISRRVRQLNSGGGGLSRPLIMDYTNLGAADIALREIIEEKIGFDLPEPAENVRPTPKKRRKH